MTKDITEETKKILQEAVDPLVSEKVKSIKDDLQKDIESKNAEIKSATSKIEELEASVKALKLKNSAIGTNVQNDSFDIELRNEELKSLYNRSGDYKIFKSFQNKNYGQKEKLYYKSTSTVNTINDIYGGMAIKPASFLGTFDSNRFSYFPILELSKQVPVNYNGNQWIGLDYSKVELFDNVELEAAKKAQLIKQSQVVITAEEISMQLPISNKIIDSANSSSVYYDLVQEHQNALYKGLDRKLNNDALTYIKSQLPSLSSFELSVNNTVKMIDLIEMLSNALKDYYMPNATLIVNKSFLTTLAKEVGNDGQFIWRDILKNSGNGIISVDLPVGSIKIVSISEFADVKFDSINPTNFVGVLADWNEFFATMYSNNFMQMKLMDHTQADGYSLLYARAYAGYGIVNKEAAKVIKMKS